MMAGSEAEERIRADVCDWCKRELPAARLIHELPVGGCRADLAAVEVDRLILFEFKSERDTLERLEEQVRQFGQSGHSVIVVAAHKWFDRTPYNNGAPRFAWQHGQWAGVDIWAHPETTDGYFHMWRHPHARSKPPHPWHLLEILWHDELMVEAASAGLRFKSRATNTQLIAQMLDEMPGSAIRRAACRQLRARKVLRGDPPAIDDVMLTDEVMT